MHGESPSESACEQTAAGLYIHVHRGSEARVGEGETRLTSLSTHQASVPRAKGRTV